MFGTSKPTASLSSGLLARKGQARPAMRPQGYVGPSASPHDDLGWNDMGHDPLPATVPAPAVHAVPPAPMPAVAVAQPAPPVMAAVPPVLRQREVLQEEIAGPSPVVEVTEPAAPRPVTTATAARIAREVRAKRAKAAFTLRLDADRHLRLRLASAVRHQSAQQIVTEALDAFLEAMPEVGALIAQLPDRAGR